MNSLANSESLCKSENPLVAGLDAQIAAAVARYDPAHPRPFSAADAARARADGIGRAFPRRGLLDGYVPSDGDVFAAAERIAGLSTCHIFPLLPERKPDAKPGQPIPYWRGAADDVQGSITFQGGIVTIRKPKLWLRKDGLSQGGGRGVVREFSKKSRLRLMRLAATTKGAAHPDMATLTYPGQFSGDYTRWKRDLKAFWQRLERIMPGASFIWKLEPQKRGAPHYHLLIWGVDADALRVWALNRSSWPAALPDYHKKTLAFLAAGVPLDGYALMRLWVAVSWFEIVGSGDNKHLSAGTQFDRIRSWRGVMSYAAKYMGKVQDLPENWQFGVGRWWGVYGRQNFPSMPAVTVSAGSDVVEKMLRYARRFSGYSRPVKTALTIFADAAQWQKLLDYERGQSTGLGSLVDVLSSAGGVVGSVTIT